MNEIMLSLQPGAALALVLDKHDSWRRGIRSGLEGELRRILQALGIPGAAKAEIAQQPAEGAPLCRLLVNQQACGYPDEAAFAAVQYVCPPGHPAIFRWRDVNAWLRGAEENDVVEALRLVCRAALEENLVLLLGPGQRAAYLELLPREERRLLEPLLPALAVPLQMGISLRDVEAVSEALRPLAGAEHGVRDAGESLAGALRPQAVEISMPRRYLQALTSGIEGSPEGFGLLRDGLFYELGAIYPLFRFAVDETLRPNGIALKVNDWTTAPIAGLAPGECLVNSTVELLAKGIKGRPAVNPANGLECAIIDAKQEVAAKAAGLHTWSAFDYVILACAATLRRKSACFIDVREARHQFEVLEQAFPALTAAAQKRYGLPLLTRVLRLLLQEEVSIRNLRFILEALLDFDCISVDDGKMIVFDERLPMYPSIDEQASGDPHALAAFVRMRMKDYLAHKYTRGGNTLVAYLLDQKLESALAGREKDPDGTARRKLLDGVREELGGLVTNAAIPAILTVHSARWIVRETLMHEFPRVPVVSYQELSPRLNIQPIARILG